MTIIFSCVVAVRARRLRYATLAALAVVLGFTLYIALAPRPELWAGAVNIRFEFPDRLSRIVTASLFAWSLWQLARMLRLAEAGDLFGPASVRHFRSFALFLFLSSIAAVLLPILVSLAGTAGGEVALLFRASDFWALFVSGLLFFIARLFDEAQRLAEDSSSIV